MAARTNRDVMLYIHTYIVCLVLCVLFCFVYVDHIASIKAKLRANATNQKLCLHGYTTLEFGGILFLFAAVC